MPCGSTVNVPLAAEAAVGTDALRAQLCGGAAAALRQAGAGPGGGIDDVGFGTPARIARRAMLGSILPAGLMQTRPPTGKAGSGPPTQLRCARKPASRLTCGQRDAGLRPQRRRRRKRTGPNRTRSPQLRSCVHAQAHTGLPLGRPIRKRRSIAPWARWTREGLLRSRRRWRCWETSSTR